MADGFLFSPPPLHISTPHAQTFPSLICRHGATFPQSLRAVVLIHNVVPILTLFRFQHFDAIFFSAWSNDPFLAAPCISVTQFPCFHAVAVCATTASEFSV
ncbi:hypothetical protein, unlikely [Trypanosoma brucei gambiense DAL972]|uniref:Uncharacterized protein n=1 Tax=Trypanosoma brucei gambiense (strain MHOM/CI/86/DAL972) TaxID=679716 RepID=C9ZZS3_TRYB9|nr:hypothetical protein, unlikely [Trypanosoma brucei gambiense DAL972]CBH16481.1 hypothetical protein, unlikely [Trypanosoma brucei gambiense DAL972]|eukprot:XP_011778745.1 hypothetical protein, unlikely [Trypanosoma brucei gambiense DAL972]